MANAGNEDDNNNNNSSGTTIEVGNKTNEDTMTPFPETGCSSSESAPTHDLNANS